MIAVKGNVEYRINETEKDAYINNGFDILDDEGGKVADGAHKSISIEKYNKLKKDYEALKAKDAEKENLEQTIDSLTAEKENLINQVTALTSEKTSLEEQVTKKDKEIEDLKKKIK